MKKTSPSLKAYPRIYLTSDNFMKRISDQIKLKKVIWVWREFSDLKKQLTSTFLKSGKRKSVSLFLESEFRLLTTKVRVQEHEVLNWARLVIILTPYHFPDFSWEFWLVFTVKKSDWTDSVKNWIFRHFSTSERTKPWFRFGFCRNPKVSVSTETHCQQKPKPKP